MTMSSLYYNIQISTQLGCGGTGNSFPGCASHKSPSTSRCYPITMGQQHLVESLPRRAKAVLKVKGGIISMVFLIIL